MALAILVAADAAASLHLPLDRRPVVLISNNAHVRTARAMLAAAGHRGCDVVSSLPADAELLVLPSQQESRAYVPCVVRYNAEVLRSLLPGSAIIVGSVRTHAPSVTWLVDAGAEIVRLGPAMGKETFVDHPPVTLNVDLNAMGVSAVGLQSGIGQKIVLRSDSLQGVRLRDGDRIVSPPLRGYDHTLLGPDGAPALVHSSAPRAWRYQSGALYSHVRIRLRERDVRMGEPNVLVPRRFPAPTPSFDDGDRVHATLVWADGTRQDFDAQATVGGDGSWSLALRVPTPLLLDVLGICYSKPGVTAKECIADGGVYDRPCTHDTECPYFDPRRAVGRCLNGTCRMPLAVGNASFRVADPATPALMGDCDPNDAKYPYCTGLPTAAMFA